MRVAVQLSLKFFMNPRLAEIKTEIYRIWHILYIFWQLNSVSLWVQQLLVVNGIYKVIRLVYCIHKMTLMRAPKCVTFSIFNNKIHIYKNSVTRNREKRTLVTRIVRFGMQICALEKGRMNKRSKCCKKNR